MVSVVIPTLTEASTVGRAIASARAALGECELVVVDAGSVDGTREVAAEAGARVVVAAGSRATAMNVGAGHASGDVLLFLHADTTLPPGAGSAIRDAVASHAGGAFRLGYDDGRPLMRALDGLRSRMGGPVYGDQAIFVTRSAFDQVGGFPAIPIMEDFDLVRRLRRHHRFIVLPLAVETAARRHRQDGTARTLARMWVIQALYRARVSPVWLARRYPPTR